MLFQKRLKTLIKKAKDLAEFVFIDGPHLLESEGEEEQRCWWLPGEHDPVCRLCRQDPRSQPVSLVSSIDPCPLFPLPPSLAVVYFVVSLFFRKK